MPISAGTDHNYDTVLGPKLRAFLLACDRLEVQEQLNLADALQALSAAIKASAGCSNPHSTSDALFCSSGFGTNHNHDRGLNGLRCLEPSSQTVVTIRNDVE